MAQQLLPFRSGTRQRLVLAGTGQYPFTVGTTNNVNVPLPNIGEGGQAILKVRGTITYSAGTTFTIFGPWSIIQNIQLFLNLGSVSIWNTTGYGGFLAQRWQKEGWDPSLPGIGGATPDANVYVFPTSGGPVAFELTWFLTISLNDGLNFELGLLNMQSPQVQANVNLTMGTAAQIGTNITAASGNVEVWYWYYDIGDPGQFALPPLTLVRTLEDLIANIAGTGDSIIIIPQLGVMCNLTSYTVTNAALSDAWSQSYLRVNRSDYPYIFERQVQKAVTRRGLLLNPQVGIADWIFLAGYGPLNMGDFRDCWDTEAFAEFIHAVTIPAGTTLVAGDAQRIVRRVVQMLQSTPQQAAA